jgi:hypothetical protein
MSAVLSADAGTRVNRTTTALHIPTSSPVSQAKASSGGNPTNVMTGEK